MGKRKQPKQGSLDPAGSRVRPGIRRVLAWLLHTGKLAALFLVALTGWGIYDALTSPRYRVRVVDAAGVQALTSEDVAALAAVDDQPIWFVQPALVVSRVKQSPYVERAEARLVLPDRLEVTVAERKPEVRWLHGGTAYAVTWDGLVVDQAPPLETAPAPLVAAAPLSQTAPLTPSAALSTTGALSTTHSLTPSAVLSTTPPLSGTAPLTPSADLSPKAASPDDRAWTFASTMTILDTTPNRPLKIGDYVDADALELARRVSLRAPHEIPAQIARIEWDGGLGVSLILGDGRQVVLGKSDDLDRKLATLRFLLNDNTAFRYLDLRPTTPWYR